MKRTAPVTVDELRAAMAAGDAAYRRRRPLKAVRLGVEPETEDGWQVFALADHPVIDFIGAIFDAFPDDPNKAQAAVERALIVGREAFQDRRAEAYLRRTPDGHLDVHGDLLEAVATVPLYRGEPCPLERVFGLVEKIRRRRRSHARAPRLPDRRRGPSA